MSAHTSRRRVVLLGSTGSIGCSTLRVASELPDEIEIVALAACGNIGKLAEQVRATGVRQVAIYDASKEDALRALLPPDVKIHTGPEGLQELTTLAEADVVLIAIVGTAGLYPALAAIEAGKDLAIASKEILVMAGEIITAAATRRGVRLLPVDSEHNAIFQCLDGHRGGAEEVSRLILTASGGPFRTLPKEEIAEVTLAAALKHPTWEMGPKITIDSATLFNKGLEMIEARWLFGIGMDRIDVVVHPQSIIHSMVEFTDGSVLAQLSRTDMGFPIQYALTWPRRVRGGLRPLDFPALAKLEFEAPRTADFPALDLARRAGSEGGTLPAVYNAANEIAVEAFREGRISFPGIWKCVAAAMDAHTVQPSCELESVVAADRWAREIAAGFYQILTPMHRLVALIFLLTLSHAGATLAEAQSVMKSYKSALDRWTVSVDAARTPDARAKAWSARPDATPFARKVWAAIGDSLDEGWVLEPAAWFLSTTPGLLATTAEGGTAAIFAQENEAIRKAVDAHHLTSPNLAPLCSALATSSNPKSLALLEKIQASHPDPKIQGIAALGAAMQLKTLGDTGELMRKRLTYLRKAIIQASNAEINGITVAKLAEDELYIIRYLTKGRVAPDLVGVDSMKRPLSLSAHKGKVIVLLFWNSNVPDAQRVVEITNAMHAKFQDRPLVVIGVNNDSVEKLRNLQADGTVPFTNFSDPENALAREYRVGSWPLVYVLDGERKIHYAGAPGSFAEFTAEALLEK